MTTNRNEPPVTTENAFSELAAMKALAEQGIRTRSSRQRDRGDFPDLPWVGDVVTESNVRFTNADGTSEQLELFPGETP